MSLRKESGSGDYIPEPNNFMEILRFTVSGVMACFRIPYVNKNAYFTYGNIHKNALIGILGAILGYGGYIQQFKKANGFGPYKKRLKYTEESYPEFYEKLWPLKVSIIPKYTDSTIPRNMVSFNNSTGFASKEEGGNLIVTEQVLEHPAWEIAVLIDCAEAEKVKDYIVNQKGVFFPYLGRNDYPASISDIRVEKAVTETSLAGRLHSLWIGDRGEALDPDEDMPEAYFYYTEQLPYGMDGLTNLAYMKKFIYCNSDVKYKDTVYTLQDGKRIMFY